MFSGLVQELGSLTKRTGSEISVQIKGTRPKKGDSIAINGVCLTVTRVAATQGKKQLSFDLSAETLGRTTLAKITPGTPVNVERALTLAQALGGHIVQGHVDQTATCTRVEEADGSWYFTFEYPFDQEKAMQGYMTVEKGSVTVNGVSLTVVNSKDNSFQVAIIPYTYHETNFHTFEVGTTVNLEFDIIGKYLSKLMTFSK
jgi:riboflavin synthase